MNIASRFKGFLSYLIEIFSLFIVFAILAKLVGLSLVYFFLPYQGIDKNIVEQERDLFSFSATNSFGLHPKQKTKPKPIIKKKPVLIKKAKTLEAYDPKAPIYVLSDFTLNSIFVTPKKQFVIAAQGSQSVFLEYNESFKNYRLVKIAPRFAIFIKNGKQYRGTLFAEDKLSEEQRNLSKKDANKKVKKKSENKAVKKADTQQELSTVPRDEIKSYQRDISKIWQNIGIMESKKDGKIEGFKVTFVKKGSIFTQLGLQRGDLMLEANGVKLDSYGAAFKLYREILNYDSFKLVVVRNGKQKELEYEIF